MKTEKLANIAGGRAFLDPLALALMLPLMLVSSLLTVNQGSTVGLLFGWLIANLIAFATCALIVIFLIRIPFKNRALKPIPIFLVFAVGAFLGLVKGLVTSLVAWRLGFFVEFEQQFLSRISQTTIVGLFAIPALAVLGDFRFRFQEERDRLVFYKVRAALDKNHLEGLPGTEDDKRVLLNFIQQAKSMVRDEVSADVAFLIRNVIENFLRPLSHRLWNVESSKLENFKFSTLVRLGLTKYPFLIKPLVFVYAPIGFLFLLPSYGPLMALGSTIIDTLVIAATYALANIIKPKKTQVSVLVFGLVNVVATAFVMISPALVFGQDSTTWNAGVWLSTFILLFEIGFVSSFIAAIVDNHNMNRIQLQGLLEKDKTLGALENRELANFLHGTVQNRLLAIALMIESNHGKRSIIIEELDRIEKYLGDGFSASNFQNKPTLHTSLENLRERWQGFVSMEFSYLGNEEYPERLSETLVHLINEAITNSVRHGLAKNIQVQITQSKQGCEVIAIDDGIGPRQGTKGLGSDYFDSVATNGWSLEPGEFGGTVLKLSLAQV